MKFKEMKVRFTLIEEMLGTSSADPDIHRTFIASKAPDAKSLEEEVEALGVDEVEEKAITVFPRHNGQPFLWDYQIKGYFKDCCSALARVKDTESSKLTAFRKIIDGLIFPTPRRIMLNLPKGAKMGKCPRPLRAKTAQGERVALANSETVPEGTTFDVTIKTLPLKKGEKVLDKCIKEWLDFGELKGTGQWRNSGKGRFTWELLK